MERAERMEQAEHGRRSSQKNGRKTVLQSPGAELEQPWSGVGEALEQPWSSVGAVAEHRWSSGGEGLISGGRESYLISCL